MEGSGEARKMRWGARGAVNCWGRGLLVAVCGISEKRKRRGCHGSSEEKMRGKSEKGNGESTGRQGREK